MNKQKKKKLEKEERRRGKKENGWMDLKCLWFLQGGRVFRRSSTYGH